MAFRTVGVLLTADATQMKAGLLAASREVQGFDRQVSAAGANVSRSSQLMATAFKATGVAVAAGLAYSIKSAADFESAMRNVNSISRLSEEAFKAQGAAVLDLSRQLPQSAQTLAEGLYEIASSGFAGAQGLTVLEESAKAASAGLTTTDNAAKAITAVLNAYGRTAEEAADVSDVLFETVNLGVISFEELTGVIGDTVGTAAAAGVGIEQVGAAVATMTLAGISAAESGTSLNRTLQAIIDPSEELNSALQALGYESGASALEQDGLRGVMEKLRGAVGSNIEAWLALFPEIRAARGALALTANEGENYARVSAGITDANARQGATQRALNEQMKATGAQFRVFLNNINAAAVEGGTRLLPFLLAALKGMRELGSDALPLIIAAAERAGPLFRLLGDILGDVGSIVGDVGSDLAPFVGVLLSLGGGAVVGALTGLASVLSIVTGFLADHPGLVTALAAAYGAKLAVDVGRAVAAHAQLAMYMGRLRWEIIASTVAQSNLGLAIRQQISYFGLLGLAIRAVPYVALISAVFSAVTAWDNANDAAKALSGTLKEGLDLQSLAGLREHLRLIGNEQQRIRDSVPTGVMGFLSGLADALPLVETGYFKAAAAADKLRQDQEKAAEASVHLSENVNTVANATGRSTHQVEQLAAALGVNLTKAFGESGPERQKLIDHVKNLEGQLGGAMPTVEQYGDKWLEQATKIQESMDETVKKVGEAFASATSIIGNFTEGANLSEFLTTTQRDAEAFVTNVRNAAARGLDPALIQQLLEAGPAKAKPFLEAIANDLSGNLIRQANSTQETLGQISSTAIELARVTQRGINTESQQMAGEFDTAMAILRAKAELGAGATSQAIAAKLGMGVADIERIGRDYVITWAGSTAALPTVGGATAQATADQIRAKLGELPAFSFETGTTMTGGFKQGLDPIVPNTINTTSSTAAAVYGAIGPLPEFTRQQAQMIQSLMAAGLDPMVPKTAEQAAATGEALRNQINRLPPDAQETGRRVVDRWLEQLQSGLGPTDAKTAAWVGSVRGNLNVLLKGVGAGTIGAAAAIAAVAAAEGGYLPNDARFQRPGTLVQWAEPETQGEWFFPEGKKDKNLPLAQQMLEGWGYTAVPDQSFAVGGTTIPRPPDFSAYGTMVGHTATQSTGYTYDKIVDWVRKEEARRALEAEANVARGSGPQVSGLTAAASGMVNAVLGRFPGARMTSGYRSPAENARVGGAKNSDHMYGRAADFVGPNMGGIAAFLRGYPDIKQVLWQVAGHYDHVHGATRMALGGFNPPTLFDRGGWLQPGITVAANNTGRPERVGPGLPAFDYTKLAKAIAKETGPTLAAALRAEPPITRVDDIKRGLHRARLQ